MINWFNFLLEKVYEELDILLKLILIDNKIEGDNYNINKLIDFLKFYQNQHKNFFPSSNYILIEERPETLIKTISDNLNKESVEIIILKNNLGLNKWIKQKYEEFANEFQIENRTKISITNHFKLTTGKVLIIGSESFTEEMKQNSLIPYKIIIEEEN